MTKEQLRPIRKIFRYMSRYVGIANTRMVYHSYLTYLLRPVKCIYNTNSKTTLDFKLG